MKIEEIIEEFEQAKQFTNVTIEEIEKNRELRIELVHYFDRNKNRKFVQELLSKLTELRKDPNAGISGDSLMLACYLLGKHCQIEDCLQIWETKRIDFDTYCYMDIQLVPFMGVQATIEYLKKQISEEAKEALEYVVLCSEAGDFDDLEKYYNEIP